MSGQIKEIKFEHYGLVGSVVVFTLLNDLTKKYPLWAVRNDVPEIRNQIEVKIGMLTNEDLTKIRDSINKYLEEQE